MIKEINNKIKVKCIEYKTKYPNFTNIETVPISWIENNYNTVDNFIKSFEGNCREPYIFKEIISNDYLEKHIPFLKEYNNKIIKAIEMIKNNNINDKQVVIKYLESLI